MGMWDMRFPLLRFGGRMRGSAETGRTQANQGAALHIIRSLSAVYHQPKGLDIIKPQENTRWREMRCKGGLPPLMICTARCAVMICQACGLDKKIRILSNADFLTYYYKIDSYKAIVQKQSRIFAFRVHLSLGGDWSKK